MQVIDTILILRLGGSFMGHHYCTLVSLKFYIKYNFKLLKQKNLLWAHFEWTVNNSYPLYPASFYSDQRYVNRANQVPDSFLLIITASWLKGLGVTRPGFWKLFVLGNNAKCLPLRTSFLSSKLQGAKKERIKESSLLHCYQFISTALKSKDRADSSCITLKASSTRPCTE